MVSTEDEILACLDDYALGLKDGDMSRPHYMEIIYVLNCAGISWINCVANGIDVDSLIYEVLPHAELLEDVGYE